MLSPHHVDPSLVYSVASARNPLLPRPRASVAMTTLKWAVVLVLSLSFAVFVTFFGRLPALR